jgi:hypothetical protein
VRPSFFDAREGQRRAEAPLRAVEEPGLANQIAMDDDTALVRARELEAEQRAADMEAQMARMRASEEGAEKALQGQEGELKDLRARHGESEENKRLFEAQLAAQSAELIYVRELQELDQRDQLKAIEIEKSLCELMQLREEVPGPRAKVEQSDGGVTRFAAMHGDLLEEHLHGELRRRCGRGDRADSSVGDGSWTLS